MARRLVTSSTTEKARSIGCLRVLKSEAARASVSQWHRRAYELLGLHEINVCQLRKYEI